MEAFLDTTPRRQKKEKLSLTDMRSFPAHAYAYPAGETPEVARVVSQGEAAPRISNVQTSVISLNIGNECTVVVGTAFTISLEKGEEGGKEGGRKKRRRKEGRKKGGRKKRRSKGRKERKKGKEGGREEEQRQAGRLPFTRPGQEAMACCGERLVTNHIPDQRHFPDV